MLLSVALAAGLALAGCGENTTGASGSPVSTPTGPDQGPSTAAADPSAGLQSAAGSAMASASPETSAAAEPPPATAAGPPADAAPSVAPEGSGALPGVPAVTGATDLAKEPTVAKGTGAVGAGLVTRDLVVGTGAVAGRADTVSVRYVGTLFADGTVFDASWKRGSAPIDFPLSGVIKGFAQGIPGMAVGGRREIVIPSALGYGATGQGPIPPNSDLVFIVDLVKTGASAGG